MGIRMLTHYQLLMVDPSVDDDVLTTVYRRLVQRTNLLYEDDERRREKLRVLQQAYLVLHDPERRRRYDLRLVGAFDREALLDADATEAVVPVSSGAPVAVPVRRQSAVAVVPVAARPLSPVSVASRPQPTLSVEASKPAVLAQSPSPMPTARRPPVNPGARVLDFGRYTGWTLRQVALRDPDYLEWLRRTPGGRQFQSEIASILATR